MTKGSLKRRFPFGRPVLRRAPLGGGKKKVFVLGAYPSAFHVTWAPPLPYEEIQALAVDNEPEPFWNGRDERELFAAWKRAVGFEPGHWGKVEPAGPLNGASGRKLDDNVLAPLGVRRGEAWVTDCLETYRSSVDAAARLSDSYDPFARFRGLPASFVFSRPSENAVVQEALAFQKERLKAELEAAAPELIITLGNAALRVMDRLVEAPRGVAVPSQLSAQSLDYGRRLAVRHGGRLVEWLPLAHPGTPKVYRRAHEDWVAALSPGR